MDKHILLDVDGVLLNWIEAFERYMLHQGHNPSGSNSWYMEDYFKISRDEAVKHIKTFNDGHWEFGTLDPIKGAKEGMKHIVEMGLTPIAITSCSTKLVSVSLRKANLYWCFGDVFRAVHCVGINQPKDTHLASYEPSFWIEDKMSNARLGLEYKHCPILLNSFHNLDDQDDGVIRADDWEEIIKIVVDKKDSVYL